MYGYCEEIEIRDEVENLKEISKKWPHLVEAHIASLHEDVRGRVRTHWRLLRETENNALLDAMQRRANDLALQELARSSPSALHAAAFSGPSRPGLFGSLLGGL